MVQDYTIAPEYSQSGDDVARAVAREIQIRLTPQQQADFDAPASGQSRTFEPIWKDTTSLSGRQRRI